MRFTKRRIGVDLRNILRVPIDTRRSRRSVNEMAAFYFVQRALRRERVFRDRNQPLDTLDDVDLIPRYMYRFPKRVIRQFVDGVDANIRPFTYRSHSIPTQSQVDYWVFLCRTLHVNRVGVISL